MTPTHHSPPAPEGGGQEKVKPQTAKQAAWAHREKYQNRRRLLDADLYDSFLAGVEWAEKNIYVPKHQ